MSEVYNHVLYEHDSVVPVICERKDWKKCPEHKHLTDERPDIKPDKFFTEVTFEPFIDDPNDDIISIAEYGATSVAEEYVHPAHEEFKPAGWEPHKTLDDTEHDKQTGLGRVLKTIGAVAGIAGATLLLSACSASTLNSGTVSDASHHEAYNTISSVCTSTGKSMSCHPVIFHHPERWTITIEGTNAEGQPETRTLEVEEPVFNETHVGDNYTLSQKEINHGENMAAVGNIALGAVGVAVVAGGAVWGGIAIKNKIEDLRWEKEYNQRKW